MSMIHPALRTIPHHTEPIAAVAAGSTTMAASLYAYDQQEWNTKSKVATAVAVGAFLIGSAVSARHLETIRGDVLTAGFGLSGIATGVGITMFDGK